MKMKAVLPKGEDNGIEQLEAWFLDNPFETRLCVVRIVNARTIVDYDKAEKEAVLRVAQIEAVAPGDVLMAEDMLNHARAKRTGQEPLPLEDVAGVQGE